jgi:ribonuclease R
LARKGTRGGAGGRRVPAREEVLAYVAEHPGAAGKRDIARAFGVKGTAARIALRSMLTELKDEGVIEKKKGRLKRPGDVPALDLVLVTGRDRDGELLAEPVDWPSDQPPPRIVLTFKRNAPTVGVGDRVLARIAPAADAAEYIATPVKVVAPAPSTAIGVIRRGERETRLEPVDRKQKEIIIGDPGKAKEGDLVRVEVVGRARLGLEHGRIAEIIGSMKTEKAVSLIAILAHGIPHVFQPETLAEAEGAKPAPLAGREDWRALPLVTIDPVDAKDHDDAVHAAPDPDASNPGGHVVTVAIADVAWYVRPGSALDREALNRGNSVYFPDRVVPMLPERISNDLCSLRELEDRPALAVRMVFSADGRKRSHRFHRIMMRSAAKLSYQEAQDAFDGGGRGRFEALRTTFDALWQAYGSLKVAREERGPLDLDLPERKVILGQDGSIDRIVVPQRLEAHRLIEEFMIQANVAAAETLEEKRSPQVYRIHDTPSLAKLEALREFLKSIELSLPKSGNLRPAHFNAILARVVESEHGPLLHEVVLRTQAQAEYSPENIGHFGLNLRRYSHFTSPIRRYADLIVHRSLVRALRFGEGGLMPEIEAELPEIAARISAAERRAMAAERDTIDRLVAHWLADRIGASFTGRISGVTRAGLFVKLDDTGADGFVPMRSLGSDYFIFDEDRHALVGRSTREMHRLGDLVEVKLVEAAPLAGALRFELLSPGRVLPRSQRGRDDKRVRRKADGKDKPGRKGTPERSKKGSTKPKGRRR